MPHATRSRTLCDYKSYLAWLANLGLSDADLRRIPVHDIPALDGQDFLSLGYISPGAPLADPTPVRPAGTRQLYAYKSDVPTELWDRLRARLMSHGPSGQPRPDDTKFGVPSPIKDESRIPSLGVTVNDPVCGACIKTTEAGAEVVYEGDTYYFCAPECRLAFLVDPLRYARR